MHLGGYKRVIGLVFGLFWLWHATVPAMGAMTSTNYQINWDSINVGGLDTASSASYLLRDGIGEFGLGSMSSSSYAIDSGYRGGVYDPVVSVTYYLQNTATQVAATLLASTTVTVTTTSGYAVNDYVVLIQDEGISQVAAVGKISSVDATTMTVDSWTTNGTTPTIDGAGGDYVYELNGTALSLGSLASARVGTAIVAWDVSADVSQGYGVYVFDSGNPSTGTSTFSDVTDGAVTAGVTEYGARSSDTTLSSSFDTQDAALTTTPQIVASRADNAFISRDFLTFKASADTSFTGGTYSGTVTFVFVGDY